MNKNEIIEAMVGGERFTNVGVYRFDKLVFGIMVLVMLATFVIFFLMFGSDRSYNISYHCEDHCENPFWKNYPVCQQMWPTACTDEYVNGPFDWNPAPWIVKAWVGFIVALVVTAVIVNHFLHNRNLNVSDDP